MRSPPKTVLFAGLGICTALASIGARAAESSYLEFGYAMPQISFAGYSATPGDIFARAGYNFTKNLAGEVMAAAGVSAGNISGVTLKLDSAYGAYLKAQFEAAPHFEVYGRAGWVHSTLSSNAVAGKGGDSSFSYGVGAQYLFTKNWYVQGDYTSYFEKSGVTIRGPAVAFGYRF